VKKQLRKGLLSGLLALVIFVSAMEAVTSNDKFTVPRSAIRILQHRCMECHHGESAEGNVRFDTLANLSEVNRLELLNKAQEQLYFRRMPPEDAELPKDAERELLLEWFSSELNKFGISTLEEKLRKPEYGNYVDHDKLFSGEFKHLKGFTHDRRWLISEFIFDAKINQLIDHSGVRTIDDVRINVLGDNGVNISTRFGGHSLRQSITNPFLLPTNIGVRYYDTTTLSGGHLLTMISNAKKMAAYMSSEEAMKTHYPVMYRIMKLELEHRNILESRERFLNNYIENVVQDLYQDKN